MCADLPYEVHAYQDLGNLPHLMISPLAAQQPLQTSENNNDPSSAAGMLELNVQYVKYLFN